MWPRFFCFVFLNHSLKISHHLQDTITFFFACVPLLVSLGKLKPSASRVMQQWINKWESPHSLTHSPPAAGGSPGTRPAPDAPARFRSGKSLPVSPKFLSVFPWCCDYEIISQLALQLRPLALWASGCAPELLAFRALSRLPPRVKQIKNKLKAPSPLLWGRWPPTRLAFSGAPSMFQPVVVISVLSSPTISHVRNINF